MEHRVVRLCLLLAVAGVALLGHATWIAPLSGSFMPGSTVKVRIGNGHTFPDSEAAAGTDGLSAYIVSPSGKKSNLAMTAVKTFLEASYEVGEAGMHRLVLVRDRGILSRTPNGVKPGGRDKNPDATQSMKSYSTAIAFAGATGSKLAPKPLGLQFEAVPRREKDSVTVTVLHDGKPCAGAELRVVWPGKQEEPIGKTGSDGKLQYQIPAGANGPFLIIAALAEKAPAGAAYDSLSFSSTLYFSR